MRKVLAILLPVLLFLTACGGGQSETEVYTDGKSAGAAETLESVRVTDAGEETAPTVEFDSPLTITETAARAVTEGDGAIIEAGNEVSLHLMFLNADDGSVLQDSYSEGQPQKIQLTEELKTADPVLYEVLVGTKVGAQVAYTAPVPAQEGQEAPQNRLLVFKVLSAEVPPPPPEVLTPEEVAQLDEAGELPTITVGDDGVPSIEFPENEAPADLVVKVLEEGTGEEVTEADTISANYTGWSWGGEEFDSSFAGGEPIEFPLTGVIPGWTQGLSGQKVGAKVMLVIPSELAYGDAPTGGQPAGPLAFYVEIVEKVAAK